MDRLRLPYRAVSPDIDEAIIAGETPVEIAVRLAEAKARTVAARQPGALVIGCDQVLELDGAPLGKPETRANAIGQLEAMQGNPVIYHSAVCLLEAESGRFQLDDVITLVRFRPLTRDQIERYLDVDDSLEVAGGVKAESFGIVLMEFAASADPTAIIGLPLIALTRMLGVEGIEVL